MVLSVFAHCFSSRIETNRTSGRMGLGDSTQTVLLTGLVVTTVSFVGSFLYQKWKLYKIPSNWVKIGTVRKINLYPLQSGHKLELNRAECTELGLKQTIEDEKVFQLRDRGLIVYGIFDNETRTARIYPKMTTIDVSVHDEHYLAIDAPTMRTLYVKIPNEEEKNCTDIKCWSGETISAKDCGDEAATWFSRYIIEKDSGLRLAYHDVTTRQDNVNAYKKLVTYCKNLGNEPGGLFSEEISVSLVSQKSINEINNENGNSIVSAENFHANVVVDGDDIKPHSEDNWDWIKIGNDLVLRNVKKCIDAPLVTSKIENGVSNHDNNDHLKTLENYRKKVEARNTPIMGIYLKVKRTGMVNVGDYVYINY